MGKPTVWFTGAKVVQERVDYSTDKQASNCEGVSHYKWSPPKAVPLDCPWRNNWSPWDHPWRRK